MTTLLTRKIKRFIKSQTSCYGVRHTQMILLFLLISVGYGIRVTLSVGIVAMTDPTANPDFPTYDWHDKSILLSSFFWGYVVLQIPAGIISKKFGSKWFLFGAMLVNGLFSFLIPSMAALGSWGVMICRICQGLGQGFLFPCTHHLLSKWAPLSERSRISNFVFAGSPFGTVITLPISGWVAASSFGWPGIFYIYGILCALWSCAFFFLGSDGPSEHKSITPEERNYIESSLGQKGGEVVTTPWKSILTSIQFWAILIAHMGQNWAYFVLLTQIPTFLSGVFNFDLKSNGLLSAAPYFAQWVLSYAFGSFADFLINKHWLSVGNTRKLINSIGHLIPAAMLIILGFNGNSSDLAIGLLIAAVGVNSAVFSGFQVNHIDISPRHAGTMMGITNFFANVMSIIGPLTVQVIVTDESNTDQWKIVFLLAAAIYVAGDTFYLIFASGEKQPWDALDYEKKEVAA